MAHVSVDTDRRDIVGSHTLRQTGTAFRAHAGNLQCRRQLFPRSQSAHLDRGWRLAIHVAIVYLEDRWTAQYGDRLGMDDGRPLEESCRTPRRIRSRTLSVQALHLPQLPACG